MGSRKQTIAISFAQAYEKLVGDIEDVAAVVRESADNMAERAPDADRTQLCESAADELESFALPDVPDGEFADVSYVIDDRKNVSKAVQVSNLAAAAEAILGQVESAVSEYEADYTDDVNDDPYGDDLREFSDALSDIVATLQNIEF